MFQKLFEITQANIKEHKVTMAVKRAIDLQKRAKIKPAALRPNLLKSKL
jgi:hypothetical protein